MNFAPVPRYLIDALLSVQVTNSAGQRSGFQLTFAAGKESAIVQQLIPTGFFDAPRRVATSEDQPAIDHQGLADDVG